MPKVENPLLLEIPDEFGTERLTLRIPRAGDGATVQAAMIESQSELKRWLGWAHEIGDADAVEADLRRARADFILRKRFTWLVFRTADGAFVGRLLLHYVDWSVPRFEIGYWVRTSLSGQGYVTEAVNGLTDFAFDGLLAERIAIECDPRNTRSAAVARRCGYVEEGVLRNNVREFDGSLSSGQVFSMLRAEWLARRAKG